MGICFRIILNSVWYILEKIGSCWYYSKGMAARNGDKESKADGDGPPKCGCWGSKVATKPRNWVGARAKFATNVMETAYRNVAAVGRNRGAPGRDSAPISQSPNPLQNKQGFCKERGHPGVTTPEKPKESKVPWLNVGFLTPARLP